MAFNLEKNCQNNQNTSAKQDRSLLQYLLFEVNWQLILAWLCVYNFWWPRLFFFYIQILNDSTLDQFNGQRDSLYDYGS